MQVSYLFFVNGEPLGDILENHLLKHAISVETILTITYQPQAVFHVRPITRCTASMSGHSESVLVCSFSPDGKRLCSGSGDTTVRFWDLGTSLSQTAQSGHSNWVLCLAWSPDGVYVASGGMDNLICIWNGKDGSLQGTLRG